VATLESGLMSEPVSSIHILNRKLKPRLRSKILGQGRVQYYVSSLAGNGTRHASVFCNSLSQFNANVLVLRIVFWYK
jgi:hypothetical protein